jgi:hypothetical protein
VATALFAAGRRQEILDLVSANAEPKAITDPILRRNVQLRRLQIAMRVCRETGGNADAMLTLLIGAEALTTDTTIRRTLLENPDLTAAFGRDAAALDILRNPDEVERHGPLLFHIAAAEARDGNATAVRQVLRQIRAWLQRRSEDLKKQKEEHPQVPARAWAITRAEIAAGTEAVLRPAGPRPARDWLVRWRPRDLALQVMLSLSHQLLSSPQDARRVEMYTSGAEIPEPWALFALIPLALAGKSVPNG